MEYVELKIQSGTHQTTFQVRKGLGFLAVCLKEDTPIEFDCKNADCGICAFSVIKGADNLSPKNAREADFLKAMDADDDERLACQCRILGDVTVSVKDYS